MITQKLSISTDKFVQGYLPTSKRLEHRMAMYNAMLEPYRLMNESWKTARDLELIRSKVTIQMASLEWFLNYLFDAELERIYIQRNAGAGVAIGLNSVEGTPAVVGLDPVNEPSDALAVPLRYEDVSIGRYRFAVFIPTALSSDTEAIRAVVRNYNSNGKDFTIIEF